jgi:hypothetical protein
MSNWQENVELGDIIVFLFNFAAIVIAGIVLAHFVIKYW